MCWVVSLPLQRSFQRLQPMVPPTHSHPPSPADTSQHGGMRPTAGHTGARGGSRHPQSCVHTHPPCTRHDGVAGCAPSRRKRRLRRDLTKERVALRVSCDTAADVALLTAGFCDNVGSGSMCAAAVKNARMERDEAASMRRSVRTRSLCMRTTWFALITLWVRSDTTQSQGAKACRAIARCCLSSGVAIERQPCTDLVPGQALRRCVCKCAQAFS